MTVSQASFKGSSKFIMLSFDSVTYEKARYRLFGMHARLIGQFVMNNQKRMENLHKQLMSGSATENLSLSGRAFGQFSGDI